MDTRRATTHNKARPPLLHAFKTKGLRLIGMTKTSYIPTPKVIAKKK